LETSLFINGAWRAPRSGQWIEVENPATGTILGKVALASNADVDAAVDAAKAAQPGWAATHPDARAHILHAAAERMHACREEMARLLTLEQGKPLPDSLKEIDFGIHVLRYYAEEGRRVAGRLPQTMNANVRSLVTRAPAGIAAGIVPWNYPVDLYCWKVAPMLAAGCAAIIKPPPEAPFAIAMAVDCLHQAGVPAGVLANLPGHGVEAGRALSSHPQIDVISATASVAAGQDIARQAAGSLKRVLLELGGHSPFIVLDDADIEAAASAALRRSFSNMGQICIAVNRILVQRAVYPRFVEALADQANAIRLGHGIEPGVEYGPVLDARVIERVERQLHDALARGGRVVAGGARATDSALQGGHFFRPTLVADAPLDSLLMNEETFGPLTGVHAFDTLPEALKIANALPYGLAAYVYTGDLETGWALADALECGMVGVNVNDTSELQAPFGGWKLSGLGRELGREGLNEYLNCKSIRMRVRGIC